MGHATTTPDERATIDLARVWVPGIHYGLTFGEYASLPYMNASTLCKATISALHLKTAIDRRFESSDSDDKLFGRALHAKLLEPDTYAQRFVVSGGCQSILKTGDNKGLPCSARARFLIKGEWRCRKHTPKALIKLGFVAEGIDPDTRVSLDDVEPDRLIVSHNEDSFGLDAQEVLTKEQAVRIEEAAAAVRRNKAVRLLKLQGGFECTVLFEYQGVKCKARLDKFCPSTSELPKIILDLKKTQVGGVTDGACQNAAARYAYDVKAQFYRHAIATVTGDWPEFVWIFVEDNRPYDINVIQMDKVDVKCAEERLNDCWSTYFSASSTGVWPGCMDGSTKPKRGILPDYMRSRYL